MSHTLLHRGVVAAAGLWIQTRIIGTHAGRERAVAEFGYDVLAARLGTAIDAMADR